MRNIRGTLTRNTDSNGQAIFNDLSVNVAGLKQLRANLGSVTIYSRTFLISPISQTFIYQYTHHTGFSFGR